MNTPARPTLISTSAGNTWVQYDVSAVIWVSQSMPITASARPPTISGLGPTRGRTCATTPAVMMMPALNGRKAKPALSGL